MLFWRFDLFNSTDIYPSRSHKCIYYVLLVPPLEQAHSVTIYLEWLSGLEWTKNKYKKKDNKYSKKGRMLNICKTHRFQYETPLISTVYKGLFKMGEVERMALNVPVVSAWNAKSFRRVMCGSIIIPGNKY